MPTFTEHEFAYSYHQLKLETSLGWFFGNLVYVLYHIERLYEMLSDRASHILIKLLERKEHKIPVLYVSF